jgi:hypothetical protein
MTGLIAAARASGISRSRLFDWDERRAILCLQHVMGEVLTRAPTRTRSRPSASGSIPLDKIDKACGAEAPFYGAGWDIDYERPPTGLAVRPPEPGPVAAGRQSFDPPSQQLAPVSAAALTRPGSCSGRRAG